MPNQENSEQGYLTTHVLDTAKGCPAAGIKITLNRVFGSNHTKITETETNHDGRTNSSILPKGELTAGEYELVFFVGDYLRKNNLVSGDGPLFLDTVPIRFGIDDETAHYHVPLLLSPYGYSTYRGS